jgi:hypothetical protein
MSHPLGFLVKSCQNFKKYSCIYFFKKKLQKNSKIQA